ncbi:DNA-directed RNA polymerase [Ceratobasidium sp. 392]|nr:DNA-directed RNA polymerase [Ceratobasidium sp. 392]
MLLRRLPKGSSRRYSVVATAKATSNLRYDTKPHAAPVSPLRAYPVLQKVEERRGRPLTLLPTPLPETELQDEMYFPSSKKQQSLAVIAACLRDLYDVKRAENVFDRLRLDATAGSSVLTVDTYNAFMLAYAQLQAEGIGDHKEQASWANKLWDVWNTLESGEEGVCLNSTTVAIAFLALVRAPLDLVGRPSPVSLLQIILDKKLSVQEMLNSPVLATPSDLAQVKSMLSMAAQEMGRTDVQEIINNQDQYMPNATTPRRSLEVPPVMPVQVPIKAGSVQEDGTLQTELPFNLRSLQTNLESVHKEAAAPNFARQLKLEESAVETTIERLEHERQKLAELELEAASMLGHASIQSWMFEWMKATEASLVTDIEELAQKEKAKFSKANPLDSPTTPFLRLLPPSKLAVITILELMRLHGTGGVAEGMKTGRALVSVGKAVEVECRAVWGKKQRKAQVVVAVSQGGTETKTTEKKEKRGRRKLQAEKEEGEAQGALQGENEPRRKATATPATAVVYDLPHELTELASGMPEWTQIVRVRLGSFLVERLMANANVTRKGVDPDGNECTESQPAFTHGYEYIRGKKLGVIRLNPAVNERMARDSVRETLHPRHLPMLVKPRPWEDYDKGGYLTLKSSMMRVKDSFEQLTYLKHASAAGHLDMVYECLDALGETPWRINEKILKVVLDVWNGGEAIAGIPPARLDIEEPQKPADFDSNPRARASYLVNMKAILNDKRNNHGERCYTNYKLEVARAFINDEFYMPHNVDFRGRAYPIPPHLNHIGDDLSRGLLLFAEARPLGETGLRWLKIHLANVFGYDKASFDEREEFVDDNMVNIMDSAEHPLDGLKWWQKADDPWQCLATCMELTAAMAEPNPALYESRQPVHQDGTCNGLQHYAALGGDETGAQHVNLEEGERPADVYSHVARMVDKVVDAEAAQGDAHAMLVQGKITRKVVKQTVMTTVYGVTFIGARDQIERQLRDVAGISREEAWSVATYLAKRVLGCIGDLFHGASQIQHWLSLSARLIAKSIPDDRMPAVEKINVRDIAQERMTSVIWTTALGLPIVQPYRKPKKKQIMTALQSVFISDPNLPTQVDPMKQSAAFPPNFVHSLDATHMMLTALECRASAITFASVHDSYWTHASTVNEMSAIIRDTFIALHSSDILVKLRAEFMERYAGYRVPLSTLTDNELCQILKTMAHPDSTASPVLLALILALVKRSKSRHTKEEPVKRAIKAAEEKLSGADLEAGQKSVESAVQSVPDEPEPIEEDTTEEFEDEDIVPTKKTEAKAKAGKSPSNRGLVMAGALPKELQYILLTDVLPLLPERGHFDVNRIKNSLYFFS